MFVIVLSVLENKFKHDVTADQYCWKKQVIYSLRASSPIWASEVSLENANCGFAARSRVLATLASLVQIGELARSLSHLVKNNLLGQ